MFSGEAEIQARRKTLSVLQDEAKRVLDAARDLSALFASVLNDNFKNVQESVERITKIEGDVENLRRMLTRELAEIGTMILNREDVLRAAYEVEEIAGYITSVAFRLANIKIQSLRNSNLRSEVIAVIDIAVEMVQRLNEVVRALTINPTVAIDLAQSVQKLERQMDTRFRALIIRVMNEIDSVKDAIMLKDILERVETMADRCMTASDSITIIALGY